MKQKTEYSITRENKKIIIPKQYDKGLLVDIMEYVDILRNQYPSKTFAIWETVVQILDY